MIVQVNNDHNFFTITLEIWKLVKVNALWKVVRFVF